MPKFNASQREAIDARNRNILVSAAAGSGKTTVMVEKIRETLIRDPEASISQFLVITFTRDAAQHMKDKLRELLEQAAREGSNQAARALSEIETASISTIHSFCTQLLKEYNDNAGATMTPRVLKDAEKKHIMDECFTDAAEQIFANRDKYSLADRQDAGFLMTAFSVDEMRAAQILTEDEARMIRLKGVTAFFRSELGKRMLASDEIKREAAFTMRIDPKGPTMVQGIIDCAFKENGEWILIDYKTDHDTAPETFVPRHEMQMNWYRTTLERLTGAGVREMWLFALRAGKAYAVERRDV